MNTYMKTKFAIGCLVQWYEVEILNEYISRPYHVLESDKSTGYIYG